MFQHNISRVLGIDRAMAPVAAGTGDTTNGDIIDTAGAESILFGIHLGAIVSTAVTTVKIQYGAASDGGDMADITGATLSVPDTGDNKVWFPPEIHRPTKRYLRMTLTRATANVTINSGFVLLGREAIQPAALGTNAGNAPTVLVSP